MINMTPSRQRELQALETLLTDASSIRGVIDALKEELALFQRTMYKNHSQHRRAAFYSHLEEVKRSLRSVNVKTVTSTFDDAKAVLQQLQLQDNDHHVSWKVLAGDLKLKTDIALRGLVAFIDNTGKVIVAAQKAFKGLSAQFAMTYFMPFTLTMCSILGRVTLLLKTLLTRAIEVHGGISLLYLNEVTKSNPLRARITALQLAGYRVSDGAIKVANA